MDLLRFSRVGFFQQHLRSQTPPCPLGNLAFREPSDVAFPCQDKGPAHEKRISELNTWMRFPPYGRSARRVTMQSHLRRKPKSMGYSFFVPKLSFSIQNRFNPGTP